MSQAQRAPFPADLLELRSRLAELLPRLETEEDWYGSAYFERSQSRGFAKDLKKTQLSDQFTSGVVLRIYDGYTLFEEAGDDLDPTALEKMAQKLVHRARSSRALHKDLPFRPYVPSSWAERLSLPLEDELRSQTPSSVDAGTPVHFGVKFAQDPLSPTSQERFARHQGIFDRCFELASQVGLSPKDLSFLMTRERIETEESIFIDREVNLSQTLYRVSLGFLAMSGSDEVHTRVGGLGGLEAIELEDKTLLELLEDLKKLKTAARIEPGKYRVLFSPEMSGVLAHEAFGHSQEGDTCARGRSKAWDLHRSGENVGNEHATILNNPAIYRNADQPAAAWGSYFFDSEGWLAQEQVILDQGVLKAPMTHLLSAVRLGVPRTANGKRENWSHGVYTRQTNTYFSPGKETYSELLSKISYGFLAESCGGGMEDPKGMGIQVGINYLKEVKDGKLTGKVFKGPSGGQIQMTGYTPDVLRSIIGKSKIQAHSASPDQVKFPLNDVGGCGKYHKEFVYAGCGGPYMLMDQVTLG